MKTIEWAAGLFEGEGCIVKSRPGRGPYLQMAMSDLDVVEMFKEAIGVDHKIHASQQRKQNKVMYTLRVGAKQDVIRILNLLLPHLGQRRAYKALNCLDELELN